MSASMDVRELALGLLRLEYADELAHLELRIIRDKQQPRFEALQTSHPEIFKDFILARTGPHEQLLKNRRTRQDALLRLVEGDDPTDILV